MQEKKNNSTRQKTWLAVAGVGIASGFALKKLFRRKGFKVQPANVISYPEGYLDKSGAKSAVTGGHPEEINQMPPDTDINDEKPVYDGSDIVLTPV
jgi:hypothetical protein